MRKQAACFTIVFSNSDFLTNNRSKISDPEFSQMDKRMLKLDNIIWGMGNGQ
ncbi:hypothetical protein GGU45_002952 [Niabella hirudinis]